MKQRFLFFVGVTLFVVLTTTAQAQNTATTQPEAAPVTCTSPLVNGGKTFALRVHWLDFATRTVRIVGINTDGMTWEKAAAPFWTLIGSGIGSSRLKFDRPTFLQLDLALNADNLEGSWHQVGNARYQFKNIRLGCDAPLSRVVISN